MRKFSEQEARDLLKRYRTGQCTKEEIEMIERWYRSFDLKKDTEIDFANADAFKAQMFENISRRINDEENRHKLPREKTAGTLYQFDFQTLRRIAAILIVGIGLGLLFFSDRASEAFDKHISQEKTDRNESGQERSAAAAKSTIYLSDGSVVWLTPCSRLEYPGEFEGAVREVTLVGEAFFDVARNPKRPFVIHAAEFTTRVLGTSFNIKAYGEDDAAEVVVVTGRVEVSVKEPFLDKSQAVVLRPNQKAVYSKKDKSLVEAPATRQELKATSDKSKLAFDDTPLKDIVNVLNTTYDINITLSNERMKGCVITADLTKETLDVSIDILSRAIHATYTIDGKNISLVGNGCGAQP